MAVDYQNNWNPNIGTYVGPLQQLAKEMQPRSILEIGIGYDAFSANVWLNETKASVTTVDKRDWNGHGARLTTEFPNRYKFIEGRSEDVLPYAIKQGKKYELIFIDGDHAYAGCKADILNAQQLLVPGGVIVMDDYGVTRTDTAVDIDETGTIINGAFGVKEACDECFTGWKEVLTHINFANGGKAYAKA